MKKGIRMAAYHQELRIESDYFQGIIQPFPNHFHEYYVIGLIEHGKRKLSCKNQTYAIQDGTVLLFNPGDYHACVQTDTGTLDYRSIQIAQDVMLDFTEEITGKRGLPGFSCNVINNINNPENQEISSCLCTFHESIMQNSRKSNDKSDQTFHQEEQLLLLLSLFIQKYGQPFETCIPKCRAEIEKACIFIQQHFAERICLDQICRYTSLSKSTLLRAFVKSKGVTPYHYLENIRISKARELLKQGISPAETALQTGFSDQSHFTNYFSRLIGLTPGAYREIFLEKHHEKL